MAPKYNFTIDRGSSVSKELTISVNGTALNLTGYTLRAQMRKTYDSAAPTAEFVCTVTSAVAGQAVMALTDETTLAIPTGSYLYDLYLDDNAGGSTRLMEGQIKITHEVTR